MHGPKNSGETRGRRPVPRRNPRPPGNERHARARVLIAEDQPITAMYTESYLTRAGIDVVGVAASGADAFHLAKTMRPDLIVMDIRLQGDVDGVDAGRRIFETTGVRCIFVSAAVDSKTRARAKAAFPLGWIPKPYPFTSLVAMIQGALPEIRRQRPGKGDYVLDKYRPKG